MRVSVEQGDPGYMPRHQRKGITIKLNGAEVNEVITADNVKGEVVRYVTGSDGKPVFDGLEFRREVLRGNVEIIIDEPA